MKSLAIRFLCFWTVASYSSALVQDISTSIASLELSESLTERLPQGCPCKDTSLCKPVGGEPVRAKEIFGFGGNGTTMLAALDLASITTIAWADSKTPQLLCEAHSRGIRLVAGAEIFAKVPITANESAREEWIHSTIDKIEEMYYDGLVFDWEEAAPVGSDAATWYAQLVEQTRTRFHERNPSYQVSTCVAWSPDNIDGRGYDYARLARASDLLYVMDYDTRSQIFDACIAAANAPYFGMVNGIQRFLDVGVDPQSLVLGFPWYGYRYPCLPATAVDAEFCPLRHVPFRGVNCSDAAGTELPYDQIKTRFNLFATTPIKWDANQMAPFFNTVEENGTVFQYWFDNPQSIALKVDFAKQANLRGVGPYQFIDSLDPDLWKAMQRFVL